MSWTNQEHEAVSIRFKVRGASRLVERRKKKDSRAKFQSALRFAVLPDGRTGEIQEGASGFNPL